MSREGIGRDLMASMGRRMNVIRCSIILAIIILFTLSIAVAQVEFGWEAEEPLDNITETNFAFRFEQIVRGVGFHNFDQVVWAGENQSRYEDGLLLVNLGHGSGSYDYESEHIVNKRARSETAGIQSVSTGTFGIEFNESVDHVYAPTNFYFGKSFRAGPFNSKGKEETVLKNYHKNDGVGVSMDSRFDNQEVMSKDLSASLYRTSVSKGIINVNRTSLSKSITRLELQAAFTGDLHIGALQAQTYSGDGILWGGALQAQSFPNEADTHILEEDYSGTYSISKRISYEYAKGKTTVDDNWIPCCSGGWNTMPQLYQAALGKDDKAIFDCTCYNAPNVAQFPRVY